MHVEYRHFDETLSDEDRERVRKRLSSARDYGPSTRQQSGTRLNFQEQINQLGQGFDATRIPTSKLYQMRRDPMIAFALQFVKVPLIRAPWYIECEDAQIAAFVDKALRRIYGRYVLQHALCLDFGYQAIVKRFERTTLDGTYVDPTDTANPEKPIWNEGTIDPIVWKPFTVLPPQDVEPKWTTAGDFDGFIYSVEREVQVGFPGQQVADDKYKVDVLHALWATNERDSMFGSVYGYPRIGYAYRFWWSFWYNWALADRHFEKDADPPMMVRYPDDRVIDSDTGDAIDHRSLALQIGEDSRSGSTVAMPSDTISSEVDGRPTNIPKWDMKPIDGNPGNFEAFNRRFEYLDIAKLRAIMVPEQAFFEGKGGTSSRNVAGEMGDRFQESQAVLMAEIDEHLNCYVIPQLVAANFPRFDGEVRKITRGFGSEDMELSKQLITLIGQGDPTRLPVNVRDVLEGHGVPVLSPEEEEADHQKQVQRLMDQQIPTIDAGALVKQSESSKPPAKSSSSSSSGVTSTGFYQQGAEKIVVSTPHGSEERATILYLEEIPGMPAALAWFDEDQNIIYFREDIEPEQAAGYLQLLGVEEGQDDRLRNSV
jgi:hypothetical protein